MMQKHISQAYLIMYHDKAWHGTSEASLQLLHDLEGVLEVTF